MTMSKLKDGGKLFLGFIGFVESRFFVSEKEVILF